MEEDSESDEEEEPGQAGNRSRTSTGNQWSSKDPGLAGSKVPEFQRPVLGAAGDNDSFDEVLSAYDYYKLFQSDDFVEQIVYQSKLYGVQKDFPRAVEIFSLDKYRCTEAMLLQSGYHHVPQRCMMWETRADCWNKLVAESIRRDDVDAILKILHFRDNTLLDDDGYFKVRPIFNNINKASSKYFRVQESFSIDEIMVPYFGPHYTKQFIVGKPVRFGYKVSTIFQQQ